MRKKIVLLVLLVLMPLSGTASMKYCLHCDRALLAEAEKVMLSQVGIVEKSSKNDGEVEKYALSIGNKPQTPYCAAGLWWSFKTACENLNLPRWKIPFPKTGLANDIFNFAKAKGQKSKFTAERYDLLVWRRSNTIFGHIEFITKVLESGFVETIGFNSSKFIAGKRFEGVFVQRRNIRHPLKQLKIRGIVGLNC